MENQEALAENLVFGVSPKKVDDMDHWSNIAQTRRKNRFPGFGVVKILSSLIDGPRIVNEIEFFKVGLILLNGTLSYNDA